jgi:hypothetical protein
MIFGRGSPNEALTLAGLKALLGLVDHVNLALPADDPAVFVT